MIFTRHFGALGARPRFPSVTDVVVHADEIQCGSPFDALSLQRERMHGGAPDERDRGREAEAS
jgi:hypothetical protein